ncbi:MAG: phage NrS-1 polymerase family protein [Eubacteriales bacterium]
MFNGLGFVFTADSSIVGVDIDHCINKETGDLNETASAIIEHVPHTYVEISPSGTGLHIFLHGKLPDDGNKNSKTGVEMYAHSRYFTMTGEKYKDAADTITDDNSALAWIHETYIKSKKQNSSKKKNKKTGRHKPLTDEKILEKAGSAEAFTTLWEGQWQDKYASQSEADIALCCKLAFWTNKNREQMDRLFRQSKLMRDKWDVVHHANGATYGAETLDKAIEAINETYTTDGDSAIFVYDGRYFRSKSENIYPLTNFTMKPVEMIVSEDETQMTADLITVRGEVFRLTFMTTDFSNLQRFKSILNRRTIALSYLGSEGDLELLKGYISEMSWLTKYGVKSLGIYEHGGRMVFVSSEGSIESGSVMVDDIVQLEKYRSIDSSILSCEPLLKEKFQKLGQWIMTYNEPAKAVSVLAWTAACFIKPHLYNESIKFPHLFLVGEQGSGKSNTLERVILPVFSRSKVTASTQVTPFILMKESASTNLIPQALDEFKPSKIDKFKLNALYNHFRDSYDGHEGIRGRADQSSVTYKLLAPLVVAGEESADEAAVRERSIELLFSKKDLNHAECRRSFNKLCVNSNLLGDFGRNLLDIALRTSNNETKKWHDDAKGMFSEDMPSRVVNNLACCYTGLCLVNKLCEYHALSWMDVFPYNLDACRKHLEYATKEYLLDGGTNNKTIVEQTLEIMSRMKLDPNVDYTFDKDKNILFLWLNHVYDLYTKYRKDYAILGEVLTYLQFKKQLLHCDFYISSNELKRIGGEVRKVWTLDYTTLKARCDVSGFEITDIIPL